MINVFFDMDGTLLDSSGAIAGAVNEIRLNMGLTRLEKELIFDIINDPAKNWAMELYGLESMEEASFKSGFEEYFIKHYNENCELFEGIYEVLEFLKSKNAFLAIATNAPQNSLLNILKKHNIIHFFDKIMGVSIGIEPKPNPQMLNLLKLEAPFKKSIFIGDSQKDKEAAINANLAYLHAKWGQTKIKECEFNNSKALMKKLEVHLC